MFSRSHGPDTPDPNAPVEDESLPRRRFISRTVLAGAGAILGPTALLAAPAEAAAGQIFSRPSVEVQKRVGRQAAEQVLKQYHEVHDERVDEFRNMGERLVAALPEDDRKKWDFNFHVIESKQINAFALPGGPMFMFTGLWHILTTLDALAAVTGHEMTHVRKEHWAKAYQQQQSRSLVLGLGLTFLHAGQGAVSLVSLANNAIGKKYSRGEEDQADEGGLQNMVDAGFNPEGMIELFTALQKVSGNGGGVGGDFLADHPLTSDRIQHTRDRIAAYGDRKFPPLTPLHPLPGSDPALSPPIVPPTLPP